MLRINSAVLDLNIKVLNHKLISISDKTTNGDGYCTLQELSKSLIDWMYLFKCSKIIYLSCEELTATAQNQSCLLVISNLIASLIMPIKISDILNSCTKVTPHSLTILNWIKRIKNLELLNY